MTFWGIWSKHFLCANFGILQMKDISKTASVNQIIYDQFGG